MPRKAFKQVMRERKIIFPWYTTIRVTSKSLGTVLECHGTYERLVDVKELVRADAK